jgi:putative cardiolipin synthase
MFATVRNSGISGALRMTVVGVWLLGAIPVTLQAAAPFEGSPFGAAVTATFAETDRRDPAGGNQLLMLSGGYDALLVRVHLIRQARKSIDIQTFIWTNDECGRLLMYELIEAARRGVKVRIIADHLASDQDTNTVAFLATAHPNLELKHYRPALSLMSPSRWQTLLAGLKSFHDLNQRMHNKVMVFDDAILITGGRNMENTYFDHSTGLNYRDRDVLAVGPVVRLAAKSFEEFWEFREAMSSQALTDVAAVIARGKFPRFERRADFDFGGYFDNLDREADDAALIKARFASRLKEVERVEFICDQPGKKSGFLSRTARITRELRKTLEQARTRVTMQTPYLVLSGSAQKLIARMKESNPGLAIRVSTNSFASTDNLLAYSANYRLRNNYIEDLRLEVHEFKPKPATLLAIFSQFPVMEEFARVRGKEKPPFLSLHAKSLVVDDRVAFIGSYNLDPRSENLNTEAGLLVDDPAFARELREQIEDDMRPENSWVIGRRPLPLRFDILNGLIGDVMSLSPIDVWPIQNTSSYELRPGATVVSPNDPVFLEHYQEVGPFPGAERHLSTKEILTRLYKAVGPTLTPVL